MKYLMKTIYALQLILITLCSPAFAQVTISGTVTDAETGEQVAYARVTLKGSTEIKAISDESGYFEFSGDQLPVDVLVTSLGYHERLITITSAFVQISLQTDPLLLNTIVISGNQTKKELFNNSTSVTAIEKLDRRQSTGIASLLESVPGVFVDGSLGEVYTRVFTRGVAASADENIGWYYQSLQEDGMPISAIQYNYFTPDFFQRTDLMTDRLEAFRGGKSGILFQNAPGGAFNFISASPSQTSTQIKATVGIQGEGNAYSKLEAVLPITFSDKWHASIGGFYRYDEGHRNVDYPWNRGGQIKGILQGQFSNAVLSLRLKYLKDQVNRNLGLSATDWEDPQAAFGQNFNSTAVVLPTIQSEVPGEFGYSFDSTNGIRPTEFSINPTFDLEWKGWDINASSKWSSKSTTWDTSFGNQPLGLESFLPYFLSGGQFPFGAVSFTDVLTNEQVAVVNNAGALNAFQGIPPEFEYISGSLPNDALLGIAPWKKEDELTEWMNQIRLSRELGQHNIQLGLFHSNSQLDYFTNAGFAFATFENQPRALRVGLQDFEGNQLTLSDDSGLSNFGALFFESGNFTVSQVALFASDEWSINESLSIDGGLRYERVNHQGELDVPTTFSQEGGIDGNPQTDFDNGQMIASGMVEELDFTYDYLSFSLGAGYKVNEQHFLFGRYSDTNKAPELNIYIQNFSGLPINNIAEVQGIKQIELGYRYRSSKFSGSATLFNSILDNVAITDFVFDQETNEIFNAPTQFNSTQTTGIELEWTVAVSDNFSLSGNQTFQDAKNDQFTIYDANDTADTSDDSTIDFTGNKLALNPNVMSRVSAHWNVSNFSSSVNLTYIGEREGNAENSFQLPAYQTIGFNVDYRLNNNVLLGLKVTNALNSAGLINFFGPNEFGSSANAATASFIETNPNASFVVVPILPRAIYLSAQYTFD